jgi:signal transduction histidine kinase
MESIGLLAGGVAHDFNNLLMAFQAGLRMLDRTTDAEQRQRVVDGMQKAIERGAALTRQLLAFSRRRPLQAKPLDLETQLTGMRELLQRSLRGDVQVEMTFDDGLWPGVDSANSSCGAQSGQRATPCPGRRDHRRKQPPPAGSRRSGRCGNRGGERHRNRSRR